MHPQYGLWHAYRFTLIFTLDQTLPELEPTIASPCISCTEKPCLHTCPVGAFTCSGYDMHKWAEYLRLSISSDCNQHGCRARLSCPAGPKYRYVDAQHLFHLRFFRTR